MLLVLDAENRVLAASRAARQGLDGIEEGLPVPARAARRRGSARARPGAVRGRGAERGAALPEPARRARRLRGAQGRLHGRRLARAAHAARAPARPARDGVACRGRTRGARRAGADGGRAHPRADRRHPVPERARDRPRGRRARLDAGAAGRRGGARSDSGDRGPRGRRRSARKGDPAAELPLRPRMLRVVVENLAQNAIRYAGPGATFTLTVAAGRVCASRTTAPASPRTISRGSSSASSARTAFAARGEPGSAWRS